MRANGNGKHCPCPSPNAPCLGTPPTHSLSIAELLCSSGLFLHNPAIPASKIHDMTSWSDAMTLIDEQDHLIMILQTHSPFALSLTLVSFTAK